MVTMVVFEVVVPKLNSCMTLSDWGFGTMEFYDFPYIGNFIIPTDELIFFRGVETTNQIYIYIYYIRYI